MTKLADQIDKGSLLVHVTKGQKKQSKKLNKKRIRNTPVEEIPSKKQFKGWTV